MKKIICILTVVMCIFPMTAFAKNNNELILLSETTKYYKTINRVSDNEMLLASLYEDSSIEISKEEFDSASTNSEIGINGSGYTETNYKKITTSIYQNGSYYRYKVDLEWKTMPSTRSYDIMAIGINPSVKITSSVYFNQYYCFTNGQCTNNGTFYQKKNSSGAGASFKLPSGNLTKLSSSLYFDVSKNVNATIIKQDAFGDYSHATKNVNETQSQNYTINSLGINLGSSISSYYDNIQMTQATWNGNW